MDQSITLSNSPSPVKLSGNSQRASELSGELYSLVQKWNLLISSGRAIINNILLSKVKSWENQEHLNHETDLENQCDQLASLVSELELLPRLMGKIKDQFVAIEKLAEFQQQRAPSNASDPPSTLFFTWKASRFVKVATTINDAFHEEFKIKKCIAENIAHCEDRQMLDFHKIAWVHQACLTPDVKLQLESLLVETGQR